MADINMVPEFTNDEGTGVAESATETLVDETIVEKETPAETPTVETPAESDKPEVRDDSGLHKQVQGLQEERVKLLKEIQELRGQRREIKKEELKTVDEKLDELTDVNPEDVKVIDKILKSKGYITKQESQKMFYESVKQEKLNGFLEEFPEYKPENDPNDLNWNALQREIGWFAPPTDPKAWGTLLRKAHKEIAKAPTDRNVEVKKQQLKTAGVGSGGVQRSSSHKSLDPDKRAALERGGWSEEEIKQIESRL